MRRSLAIALMAAFAAAVGLACQAQPAAAPAATSPAGSKATVTTPSAAATASPAAAAAKPTGPQLLNVGLVGTALTPDLYDTGVQSGRAWRYAVGQTLVSLDSGEPKGQAAASYRAVDPLTWEFKLADQRFSTGEKVIADDVVFSYQRAISTNNNVPAFPLIASTLSPTIDSVTATAPDTVTIKTKAPDAILPNKLATLFVFSRKAFDTLGPERASSIGSGPYKLDTFTAAADLSIVPNEAYIGQKGALTRITFRQVPELSTRQSALQSGELDAVEAIGLNGAKALQPPFKAVVRAADLVTGTIFDVRKPELASKDVRLGLNLAVDRKQIIAAFMDNKVEPANQIVIQSTFGHNPNLPPYDLDLNRARQLIAQGGFPNGFNTVIGYAPIVADYKGFAETLQAQFAAVNVRADIELIDPAQFIPRYLQLQLPAMFMSSYSSSNYLDALEAMRFRAIPPTNAYYGNEPFNVLFNQASSETDRTRRQQLMQQAMKISNEDPPGILGWGFAEAWGVSNKVVGFDSLPPTQLPQWLEMSKTN